jgi:hypothetical protein
VGVGGFSVAGRGPGVSQGRGTLPQGAAWLLYFHRPPTLPLAVAPAFLLLQMENELFLRPSPNPGSQPWASQGRPSALASPGCSQGEGLTCHPTPFSDAHTLL